MTAPGTPRPRPERRPRPTPSAVARASILQVRRLPAVAVFVILSLIALDAWLVVVHADRRHAAHEATVQLVTVVGPRPAGEASTERAAVASARRRVPALLSYDYHRVDEYLAQAAANTTGDFKNRFTRLVREVIGPAATKGQVSTTTHVLTVGVMDVRADRVRLLLFVDQSTTSHSSRNGHLGGGGVEVTMARTTAGSWLVADLIGV